jgi:ankyrin repeat protein/serine/threonine protein kinase
MSWPTKPTSEDVFDIKANNKKKSRSQNKSGNTHTGTSTGVRASSRQFNLSRRSLERRVSDLEKLTASASTSSFYTASSRLSTTSKSSIGSSIVSYYSASSTFEISGAIPSSHEARTSHFKNVEYAVAIRSKNLLPTLEEELNWAGKPAGIGQHVEFSVKEKVPLKEQGLLGQSITARVDKVRCRRITLARKSMHCSSRLTINDATNELEHLQRLRHTHIVRLVGSYVQGRTFAILLYPVAEFNLLDFMETVETILVSGSVSYSDFTAVRSLASFFGCMISALSYIHGNRIEHMDIKPRNFLVERRKDGHKIYVADFGISRSFHIEDQSQTNNPAGTPKYHAPEVFRGEQHGRAADIFSLGCVFSEMITVLCRRSLVDFADCRQDEHGRGAFHHNLPKVYDWLKQLENCRPAWNLRSISRWSWYNAIHEKTKTAKGIVSCISAMLSKEPNERPRIKNILPDEIWTNCCRLYNKVNKFKAKVTHSSKNWEDIDFVTNERLLEEIIRSGREDLFQELKLRGIFGSLPIQIRLKCLFTAKLRGEEKIVQSIIEEDPLMLHCDMVDINPRDLSREATPLSWAAENGHEPVIRLLLESGKVDVNIKNHNSQTPLSSAAENGHGTVVRLLLESGKVDVNIEDNDSRTPLWWAAKNGHEIVVKLLLESSKVDVNIEDRNSQTPLSSAVENGHEAVVRLLLQSGKVDVNIKDTDSRTPLWWAAKNGHYAIVRLLLRSGKVNVDIKDRYLQTPFSWAACNGHEAIVRLLLESGKVEVDVKDDYSRTPLWWAAHNGHEAVVRLLLRSEKVDFNIQDRYLQTPLSWASKNGHKAVVRLLLESQKVNVNIKDDCSQMPLSCAAKNGHEAVVRLLLKSETVEVNIKDDCSRTPLWWAARNGHEAVVRLLLKSEKVEFNTKDRYSQTPLLCAAKNGHEAVVRLLLESEKVNVNEKDNYSRSSLSYAAKNEKEAVVGLLLEFKEINFNIKDRYSQTLLSCAAKNRNKAIVRLLLDSGSVNSNIEYFYQQTPLSLAIKSWIQGRC